MKKTIILFLVLGAVFSCTTKKDGDWDDIIKLSEKQVTFAAEASSVQINTEGTWWWVHGIGLNDDWTFDLSNIDTSQNNFTIDEAEFKIERKNGTEIYISMTQNETGQERTLTIGLQAGNYADGIRIIQAAN